MSKTSSLTLETVKKHFEHWRLNKKREEKKIPEPLWLMVDQLMKRYETSKIVAQLKISTGQLRQKGLLTSPPKAIKNTFVELPSVVSFSEH